MQRNRPESQKNGELLSSILEKANISQRLCSINMGENDAFLTNFIYRSPLKFSRDFSYKFLSSIYHFVLRDSQKRATEKVFNKKKIPFRSFEINNRDEEVLGELFSFFILETILLGKVMKLNPFDQPAVELIKKQTKKILV